MTGRKHFLFDMVSRYNARDSANYLTVTLPKGRNAFQESLTEKANIKDMTRIVDLGFRMVWERAGRVA